MAALGAEEIGDPDGRAVSSHHLGDDTGAPTVHDHVDGRLVVLEHPVPASATVDARARSRRSRRSAPGATRARMAAVSASKRGFPRSNAASSAPSLKARPNKSSRTAAEPPVADVVDEAQIHHQRDDVQTERRAGLQPLGQRGQGGGAAAAAIPRLSASSTRVTIGATFGRSTLSKRLASLWSASFSAALAVRAAEQQAVTVSSRRLERAGAHRPLRPRLPWPGPRRAGLSPRFRLLALRGRPSGIVGRLRRQAEPGFRLRHPRRQRLHLRPQCVDKRVFLGVRERSRVGKPVHPELKSSAPWSRQALRRCLSANPNRCRDRRMLLFQELELSSTLAIAAGRWRERSTKRNMTGRSGAPRQETLRAAPAHPLRRGHPCVRAFVVHRSSHAGCC